MFRSSNTTPLRLVHLRGFTIVELLVGLFLSLLIVGLTLVYTTTSKKAFNVHGNDLRIGENARFTLSYLSEFIRQAGALNSANEPIGALWELSDCELNSDPACVGMPLEGHHGDILRLQFSAQHLSKGCDGREFEVMQNPHARIGLVFWVHDSDADGVNSLYCRAWNIDLGRALGIGIPVVDGVDVLRLEYGIDSNDDGALDQYVGQLMSKNQIPSVRVLSVRVGILVSAGSGVANDLVTERVQTRDYVVLREPPLVFNDAIARRVFSTTVALQHTRLLKGVALGE